MEIKKSFRLSTLFKSVLKSFALQSMQFGSGVLCFLSFQHQLSTKRWSAVGDALHRSLGHVCLCLLDETPNSSSPLQSIVIHFPFLPSIFFYANLFCFYASRCVLLELPCFTHGRASFDRCPLEVNMHPLPTQQLPESIFCRVYPAPTCTRVLK